MKTFCLSIAILVAAAITNAQKVTFYRTATNYEKFKWDKVPFCMATIELEVMSPDTIKAGGYYFGKAGDEIYSSTKGNGYIVLVEQDAFIVKVPDGNNWTCYYANKERIREITASPDYVGLDEFDKLKTALKSLQKPDPRIEKYYLTYSGFKSSANTYFAEESLSFINVSPDTLLVNNYYFKRWADKLYKAGNGDILYRKDDQTFMVRDKDISDWATYYVKDQAKANQLIGENFNPQKELADLNKLIDDSRNSRNKAILTSYIGSIRPGKKDPAFEASITKYWAVNNPSAAVYKVILVDGDLFVVKNELGITLRKNMAAWVLYKQNGKCYMQWHNYGYEALGGGVFGKELNQWQMSSLTYYLTANTNKGSLNLFSGETYEIDCPIH